MAEVIRMGTRPSPLALKQAEEVRGRLPRQRVEIIPIRTDGDIDRMSSLVDKEDSDFFTRQLEQALIDGSIDAAVHSAKDLEKDMPQELIIAAVTRSISPFECLASRGNCSLKDLTFGARVGTSSKKRGSALLNFRPDLSIKDIRGNIDERLARLDNGEFDAIIVAHAALIRLGYKARIAEVIPKEIMEPHPMQGRLAIQIRKDREGLLGIFRSLDEK